MCNLSLINDFSPNITKKNSNLSQKQKEINVSYKYAWYPGTNSCELSKKESELFSRKINLRWNIKVLKRAVL